MRGVNTTWAWASIPGKSDRKPSTPAHQKTTQKVKGKYVFLITHFLKQDGLPNPPSLWNASQSVPLIFFFFFSTWSLAGVIETGTLRPLEAKQDIKKWQWLLSLGQHRLPLLSDRAWSSPSLRWKIADLCHWQCHEFQERFTNNFPCPCLP